MKPEEDEDSKFVLSVMVQRGYTRALDRFGPRKSTEALLVAHDTSTLTTFVMWFEAKDIDAFNLDPESARHVREHFASVMGYEHEFTEGYTPVVYQFGTDGNVLTGHALMMLEGCAA